MAAEAEYTHIRERVESAGFFTTFVPPGAAEGGYRGGYLVCASRLMPDGRGLTGCSFKILKRGDDWFVETWAPRTYRIPAGVDVADVCTAFLSMTQATPADVPAGLR